MSSIKQAWMITKKDIKNEKKYLIWTIVFSAYMAFTLTLIIGEYKSDIFGPFVDFMMLMIIPMLGFYFSRRSFKYLSEDSYTQMLAYFRTLPISPQVVMLYRILQSLLSFVINGVIFFTLIYVISSKLQQELPGLSYIAFTLTWLGYAMLANAFYIYAEFLNRGKRYFWIASAVVPLMVVIALIIKLCSGNLFNVTIQMSHQWGIISPLMWGMLVIGVLSLYVSSNLTLRKLQTRDLV